MNKKLNLGGLKLPLEAVGWTFALLSVRGAGKTNAARVMAEEMFAADLPFVAVDPVGSWWGLRAGRSGKPNGGLPIVIFGGDHGDIPIERTGGVVVADAIVEQRLSCIVDLSGFDSEAAKKQFLLDFAQRLYTKNRDPLHLFLEEADDYIPQRPMRDESRLLRAWENIVRRGRARGLGMTMITQRSAAINKNVLTQVETLFTLRTTGPQDRAAVENWVKYHDADAKIIRSLSALEDGEAWIWSPHHLGKVRKFKFRLSKTFDSGQTPKNVKSKQRRKPATLADVDLKKLRKQMAETIEKSEADDPRVLKRRIRFLEKEVQRVQEERPEQLRKETEDHITDLTRQAQTLMLELAKLNNLLKTGRKGTRLTNVRKRVPQPFYDKLMEELGPDVPADVEERRKLFVEHSKRQAADAVKSKPAFGTPKSNGILPRGESMILSAVAQYGCLSRQTITALTGFKRSTRDAYILRLKNKGLVDTQGTDVLQTDGTKGALPLGWKPLPTGAELREHWLQKLPEGEAKILRILIDAFPKGVVRDDLTARTGYQRSTRDAYIHRLAKKMLARKGDGTVVWAADALFEENMS